MTVTKGRKSNNKLDDFRDYLARRKLAKRSGPEEKTIVSMFQTKSSSGRTVKGNIALLVVLALMAVIFLFPVIFLVNNAFKPLSELMRVPPLIFVRDPTLDNFFSVGNLFNNTLVPFWRYVFNTAFLVVAGTLGQIIFASMAAYPLAKYEFFGEQFLSGLIVVALMFSAAVTAVPNYIIMANLGLIDTYLAIILPSFGSTLGLYLMKNFMSSVPNSLIEAAQIDGASEFRTLWTVVMPAVKPAWITLFILSFQGMWGNSGGAVL
ncbi:MAG: carbohydrate ABC transporter permease, partial [Defluviitaleaceae bacterium]|nr:carbohydrate ABC transporter permease [Defluviitaleaceae bacterium]